VLAYASRAPFVTDPRLTDEQTLLRRNGQRGPKVRVEAVDYSPRLTHDQLRRGQLLGRFISDGEYPPLGLRRGTHYLFVDSTDHWRAIIVPEDPALRPHVMNLSFLGIPHPWDVPGARWFEFGEPYPNMPCGRECCVPCEPTRGYPCPPMMPRLGPGGRGSLP
jgi:hypothetical protein